MFKFLKEKAAFFILFIMGVSIISVAGCDDAGVTGGGGTTPNPNVKSYDSIGVEEDSSAGSFNGINLLNGISVTGGSSSRDAALAGGLGASGTDFYLRSGTLDILSDIGYETRWFRVAAGYTPSQFDTMSAVYTKIGSAFDTLDFTQEDTYAGGVWSYFNAPISIGDSQPVYCFWLKGKKNGGLTSGKNVFGILQPREATDNNPGNTYGFRMSFRVRINTNGENDFRKEIPAN